jgi:lipopolysaccharide transport system permease protein
MALNPMTALIEAFRAATVGGPIHWASLGSAAACVAVACAVGCLFFRKVEDGFADII